MRSRLLVGILLPLTVIAFSFGNRSGGGIFRRHPLRIAASTSINEDADADVTSSNQIEALLRRGQTKMNQVMTPEFFEQTSASLKQLRAKSAKAVEIKQSSIPGAGMGLFAKSNMKAGTIVSFYPAHTLGVEFDNQQLWYSSREEDQIYFSEHPPESSPYLHATDQPIFNRPSLLADIPLLKNDPMYLDANPTRKVDPLWVSHYINDGAIVTSNDGAGIEAYYDQSKRQKNCIHIPFGPSPVMATVCTRKVKKGEELFTSYGCVYWLGVLYSGENSGDAPAMTSMIQEQIKESAQDLFGCMNSVAVTYEKQAQDLQIGYDAL